MTASQITSPLMILNIDYAGRCAGACPVCALSHSERHSDRAFLSPDQVIAGFAAARQRGHHRMETLVIGVGRGNMLGLGETIVEDLATIARAASDHFLFDEGLIEISTSVMGRIEDQITRAEQILDHFDRLNLGHNRGLDARFVVVANTAQTSDSYWKHLQKFLDHLSQRRGGLDCDGSGDVLLLNLSLGHLPPILPLIERLRHYRFPVNVTWAPTLDPAARDPAAIQQLEHWLADWHQAMRQHGMDGSLVTRAAEGWAHRHSDRDALEAQLNGNGAVLLFIDKTGQLHQGFSSVSADMDPIRFASGIGDATGGLRMVSSPREELAQLLRWPACRGCEHLAGCVISGAHKTALLTIAGLKPDASLCPSGMRTLLANFDKNRKPGTTSPVA